MTNRWMVRASGLRRTFRVGRQTIDAVREVSFAVADGELLALLGPNGAGKSTTLRMLTTLLAPSAGTAQVAQIDVAAEPRRARTAIGYVGQRHAAGTNNRVRDELRTQARCYGLTGRAARARAEETLESFDLGELALRAPGTLSGGQQRRVDLALGMVHRPRVLFLDEPSSGLDPQSRAGLWQQVARLRREHGVTVVLSTHYLDEADQLADRIVIVDKGRIVADGTVAELKAGLGGDQLRIDTERTDDAAAAARIAARLPGARDPATTGRTASVTVPDAAAALPSWLRGLGEHGIDVTTVDLRRPTLDDVFISRTGKTMQPTGEAYATDPEPHRNEA